MIVELPDTSASEINKKIIGLREEGGALTLGRVLTLVIAPDTEEALQSAVDAAVFASREHPCRVIAALPVDGDAPKSRLDAELRVGHDAGAGEVVVLRLHGELAGHPASVVLPFLLPDTPVVAWWPTTAPEVPARDPLGRLAIRRITNATNATDPLAAIKSRLAGYSPGDTDVAWSRITYWRALLASAIDEPPYEPIESAVVSGLKSEPSLDVLAGWLASRIDGPVTRTVGTLKVELHRAVDSVTLSRPQDGVTATLSRTSRPVALVPLARRDVPECLAEEMRRLDADEIYHEALAGIGKVSYQ
ncbi:glucose-6-phosphate dehydrogenase assembly protein OpcA [Mycobacterium sp. Y57]|uniref:glucose-6-phosphate dehydrogenase assembly protein OpcA n=1 Tax=Mycolicibacterium xanthum TaxID=2796469 RepID=UPI001C8626C8|nr:glucose-6-phosphate dehydrogenase assembly protein OpcA [Mycolicibacterium xanthum]MBX7432945.1 glucose-6-phosphate dehydrogenase assembly protein OpcA [Mycolicibacterium xanthum]